MHCFPNTFIYSDDNVIQRLTSIYKRIAALWAVHNLSELEYDRAVQNFTDILLYLEFKKCSLPLYRRKQTTDDWCSLFFRFCSR